MPIPPAPVENQPLLKAAIEKLFNISMSMASSPDLLYQPSNPFAPPPVEVTYSLQGNIKSDSPARLWLAYGLALGVALIDVLIGLWAIASIRGSFTANFSTVFRVAKNVDVDAFTGESHLPGGIRFQKSSVK
ncbi:hypothetical protein DOTSEDRAFT_18908 [Dothistroma septosporum NZE10]|uniref:Uncharacterized protein n=1 Tax=Dothistroma septosporum (strain NZE10 / CBS 128990) TaxID=675120 RepID=N1PXX2_DOTSN|nr:hypothetical protein DOTSEDRAFT_18908 [Dothistroma septosporum NZE10]